MSVMTMAPHDLPHVEPLTMLDPKQQQLIAMFPDLDGDVLSQMLSFHGGNVELAVMALLGEVDTAQERTQDVDMELALRMTQEMNEEAAKVVMAEFAREDEERKQKEPLARAAVAVDKVADTTKKLWARVRPGGRSQTSHSTRLLDTDGLEPIVCDHSPLSEDYMPPPPMAPPPPSVYAADNEEALPPADQSSSTRYNARLDRARAANRAGNHVQDSPPMLPTAAPQCHPIPVGQLIDIGID